MRVGVSKWHRHFLLGGVLFFLADRGLKIISASGSEAVEIIPGLLTYEKNWNEGIAFSIPITGAYATFVVFVFLLGLSVILRIYSIRGQISGFSGFFLVWLGAFSNFWDRLQWGAILDYLRFWKFSVFNLADILIILGIIKLIFSHGEEVSKTR